MDRPINISVWEALPIIETIGIIRIVGIIWIVRVIYIILNIKMDRTMISG